MRVKLPIVLAIAPIVTGLFLFGLQIANAGRIIYGTHIAGVAVGGLTPEQAQELLRGRVDQFLETPLVITVNGIEYTSTPKTLGFDIDISGTVQNTFRIGRNEPIFVGLWEQATTFFKQPHVLLMVKQNDTICSQETKRLFVDQEKPVTNAYPLWNGTRLVVAQEEKGAAVNREILVKQIKERISALENERVFVDLEIQEPTISKEETKEALTEAQKWIATTPLYIQAAEEEIALSRDDLIELLLFERTQENNVVASLKRSQAALWLEEHLGKSVGREPRDARFEVEKNRVVLFVPSLTGRMLDSQASIQILLDGLRQGEKRVTLTVVETDPKIRTQDANSFGIVSLLGKGESDFAGSPKNRIHNIKTGAARFNGVLIPPQEEFSFNETLGPVTEEMGYKAELVILQDKTVPALGGGLCQVSTTAFRAAAYSGLEVTQRRSHSYVVRYYGTPGFDATIYPPNPDLRFINDTSGHILIQTRVEGTKLTFEFYGTPDGRTVTVEGPYVYDKKADGSLKATLTVKTTLADNKTREQTFQSVYKSPTLYPVNKRNPLE